jgi:hypothetical protein
MTNRPLLFSLAANLTQKRQCHASAVTQIRIMTNEPQGAPQQLGAVRCSCQELKCRRRRRYTRSRIPSRRSDAKSSLRAFDERLVHVSAVKGSRQNRFTAKCVCHFQIPQILHAP